MFFPLVAVCIGAKIRQKSLVNRYTLQLGSVMRIYHTSHFYVTWIPSTSNQHKNGHPRLGLRIRRSYNLREWVKKKLLGKVQERKFSRFHFWRGDKMSFGLWGSVLVHWIYSLLLKNSPTEKKHFRYNASPFGNGDRKCHFLTNQQGPSKY